MNFITLKELKKMVPVASEFKRVPGLKKILEDGIEVILRKQMENHAEVVVYKNGYVSYHAHERYTVFALHNCTHYYYESQGNEHQTIPHNHFEDMEWHIRLVLEGEDRLVRNLEARESETFSYAADVNPEYNNEMEDPRIATIRSREISASIILQSQSQLKTIYKDAADTITGNCDCTLFLGGKEKSTLKEISEVLGKETIDLYNTSETRSNNNSYGLNYQKTGKELMSQDEIAVMDGAKCILQLRGVRPFLSNKYDITKHPKYRQLSDYDKRNAFDIEKYRQHKLVVKPDDTFDLYDMGEVEAD